jgi:hypothetical protein
MNNKEITSRLREILCREDVENDGLINRKRSSKHEDDMSVLLEHIALLIADLRFEAEATRRELFDIRGLLEE